MISPIWSPSAERIRRAAMTSFIRRVTERCQAEITDYQALYQFSVERPEAFWGMLWDFLDIIGEKGTDVILDYDAFPGARWFPQARLNFAENHLRRRDNAIAVIDRAEDGSRRSLSWRELYDQVSCFRQALADIGVAPGDRVAACLPNISEALIAVLASTSLGALWSACAPEYGEQSLVDRLGQIDPKVLIVADGYAYGGRQFDLRRKTAALAQAVPSIERIVVIPFVKFSDPLLDFANVVFWADFIRDYRPMTMHFPRFPFDHPLYILYSSGTTGNPKAIIHSTGSCLLQGLKDMALHYDVQVGEPTLFHTNTGWMVWNTMLSVLALGAPTVLYEGSPTYPKLDALFDIVEQEKVSAVRVVPAMIDTYAKGGLHPAQSHDLTNLKTIGVGSAPLLPHHCEYVYSKIKADVHLLSPAGGTDVFGTLAHGNPIGPVYPGEIQVRSLGMSVEVFDENGRPVIGRAGELVCTRPFPSVPLGFWGDPTRVRFMQSYFSHYHGVWRHGDWAKITPRGGVVMLGRADATLNIKGVRIGTAEIYRGLEAIPEIKEAVAVALRQGSEEQIVLFVVMANDSQPLDPEMKARIAAGIRQTATARHVPSKIIAVTDIPRSLNGKPSEIAVREIIHGRDIPTQIGLSNPQAIELFRNIPGLMA
jgi:acetoacetyl-CoA synthetase